ncbi:hypothetical protein AMECASPLE_031968 [Ameca splendens]|uniref:Uncharacterized protein n=1 Tax=Ameca splendens TaxID=208324 RepID=A0ABV0ZG50_9TELE
MFKPFTGFYRLGKFTSPINFLVPSRNLAFSDLKLYPDHFKLNLNIPKGEAHVSIPIVCLDGPFCPFQACLNPLLKLYKLGSPSMPFFLSLEGAPCLPPGSLSFEASLD